MTQRARARQTSGQQDPGVRRALGPLGLGALAFGGMIGSGWLFGAYYAAKTAGPAAVLSWPIAGAAMAVLGVALTYLGATRPRTGGMVRWPRETHGPLAGMLIGWSILLAVTSALAAEATAIVQYASHYVPTLYANGSITTIGRGLAVAVLILLVLVNWFGVAVFARMNGVVTAFKLAVPVITLVALVLATDPRWSRFSDDEGIAPYGWSAVLSAITSAGIIYTFNGFAAPVEMSGEARNPRRDLPRAVLLAIGLATVLYTALQLVFIVTLPTSALGAGWGAINFDSPFGQLAVILQLGWLASLLYADAIISPTGAASVFVAAGARETQAAARNGLLPHGLRRIHLGSGVPRRALVVNLVLCIAFLLPFDAWQGLIGFVGALSLFGYAAATVSCGVAQRHDHAEGAAIRFRWIPPAGFVIATLLIYWAGWEHLRLAIPLLLIPTVVWLIRTRGEGWVPGRWLLIYAAGLLALSAVGGFGGVGWLTAPWDSLTAAALAGAIYPWAVQRGTAPPLGHQEDPR